MTAPRGRGDAPSHPIEAPATLRGKHLLSELPGLIRGPWTPFRAEQWAGTILAIEQQARDEGRREAVRPERLAVLMRDHCHDSADEGLPILLRHKHLAPFVRDDCATAILAGLNASESPPTNYDIDVIEAAFDDRDASESPPTRWRDPGVLAREASADGSPHAEPFRRGDASESDLIEAERNSPDRQAVFDAMAAAEAASESPPTHRNAAGVEFVTVACPVCKFTHAHRVGDVSESGQQEQNR